MTPGGQQTRYSRTAGVTKQYKGDQRRKEKADGNMAPAQLKAHWDCAEEAGACELTESPSGTSSKMRVSTSFQSSCATMLLLR